MTNFVPQNELERILVQATTDIGARPAFYRAFLDSTLLVIGNIPGLQVDNSGRGVVKLEDVQSIVQMQDSQGNLVIPVFSSFSRLQETHAGRVICVQLKGSEILALLGSEKPLVLNPKSEYSKEFSPGELAALLDGSIFRHAELPDNIDDYPAGAELDAILAEHVLGARIERISAWGGYQNVTAIDPRGEVFYIMVSPHYEPVPLWNPSINLSDTEVLVQHLYMHSDYRSMTKEGSSEDGYSATLWAQSTGTAGMGSRPEGGLQRAETHSVTGYGPTPALAVCRAVYKAASDSG